MTRRRGVLPLAGLLLLWASPAAPQSDPEPAETIRPAMVAIPAPLVEVKGRILQKDGVTPVVGATLSLAGGIDGETRTARSGSGGRFAVKAHTGDYRMRITRGMEIFESAGTYRVGYGQNGEVDLLLLHDVEPPPPEPKAKRRRGDPPPPPELPPSLWRGPDPRPDAPKVVGTIVEIPRVSSAGRHRWKESLGFLGSLLAIAIAAN